MTSNDTSNEWWRTDAPPSLTEGEVHLWRVSIAGAADELRHLSDALAPEERRRAERVLTDAARRRFTIGRGVLRGLLGAYVGRAPAELRLEYSALGKPSLEGGGLEFSVSHSGDVVLVGVTPGALVGVDVEYPQPAVDVDRIARRVFATEIVRVLDALPAPERADAFFRAWTQREAYVKAIGGALLPTRDPLPFSWPMPASPWSHGAGEDRWTVLTLDAVEGHPAAVVVRGDVRRFRLLERPASVGPGG